jgi:hypothetical protein
VKTEFKWTGWKHPPWVYADIPARTVMKSTQVIGMTKIINWEKKWIRTAYCNGIVI